MTYCGIIRYRGDSIFMEYVDTSHPRINILHELISYGYKVLFTFVGIREYTKLRPNEPVKFKQFTKIGPHELYSFLPK